MNLKTTDFKRNSSDKTRIYEYSTPPPPSPQLTQSLVSALDIALWIGK